MNKVCIPKLRFSGFDGEWEENELGNITKVTSGGTPSRNNGSFWNGDIPWVTTSLINFNVITTAEEYITQEAVLKSSAKLFNKGTILMAMYGQGKTRGKVAVLGIDATTNQACGAIIPNDNLDKNYLFQNLAGRYDEIRDLSNEGGQQNLSGGIIKEIKISFPSLPEQQKIASFLSSVDEKIQQLSRKKELLEQYKKGVMQQLFSGKLRFKPAQSEVEGMNGEDYPDWEEKKLGEVSVFLDGKRKPIKGQDRTKMKGIYPYYGASGIIDYVNSYIFDEEIILLGEDGENIVSRNLPLAFRVSGKCWVNNHAHVIKPINNNDIDFLTYSLERINYVIYNTGTAQPKLNQEVCRNIPLSIPSLPEQQKIAIFLSGIDDKIKNSHQEINNMQGFKKGLLQQMFV